MTEPASFTRRIRTRMESLAEPSGDVRTSRDQAGGGEPGSAADPQLSEDAVVAATGHGWQVWRRRVDAWADGHERSHADIVAYLEQQHGLEGWWAQTVTVGYERMSGRRQRFQRPDGTFTASRSRTLATDPTALRSALLRDDTRADLFPGFTSELRSRPTSRAVRLSIGEGTVQIAIESRSDGRVKVAIEHAGLSSADQVLEWQAYWSVWLEAIDES